MKIAVFLKYENWAVLEEDVVQAYTFKIKNGLVESVGNEILMLKNVNYLMIWLIDKQIDIIYANDLNDEINYLLKKIGVSIKPMKEIKENPLLKSFVI